MSKSVLLQQISYTNCYIGVHGKCYICCCYCCLATLVERCVVFSLIFDRCLSAVSSRLLVVVYLFIFDEDQLTWVGVWRRAHHLQTYIETYIHTNMHTYKSVFVFGSVWKYTYGRESIAFAISKWTHTLTLTHMHVFVFNLLSYLFSLLQPSDYAHTIMSRATKH